MLTRSSEHMWLISSLLSTRWGGTHDFGLARTAPNGPRWEEKPLSPRLRVVEMGNIWHRRRLQDDPASKGGMWERHPDKIGHRPGPRGSHDCGWTYALVNENGTRLFETPSARTARSRACFAERLETTVALTLGRERRMHVAPHDHHGNHDKDVSQQVLAGGRPVEDHDQAQARFRDSS